MLLLTAVLALLVLGTAATSDDREKVASKAASTTASAPSDVVTLTDANFDQLTASGSWLLEFYAPWCGHCKALAPTWEKAATELRHAHPAIRLGTVDCTAQTTIASRYSIRGYPTIKFLRGGAMRPYTGGRSLSDITAFAKRMTEPAVREVVGAEEVESVVGKEGAVFVLLGGGRGQQAGALAKTFGEVAFAQQGNAAFLHLPNPPPAALSQYGAKANTPTIVYLSRGQEQPELLTGDVSASELTRFVQERRIPLVSTLSADNFDELTNSPKKLALLVLPSSFSQSSTSSSLIDSLYPLARRYRDKLHIATVDGSRYQRWLQAFVDTQQAHLPALLVFADYPDTVWKPDTQPMGEADIGRMLTEVMDGTRPGTSSTTWYSPQRYLRPLNRFLQQFEEWQLITAVVVIAAAILGGVVAATSYCMGDTETGQIVDQVAGRAQAVAGRAEKELKHAAQSGVVAAKKLAKSIDKAAEKVAADEQVNKVVSKVNAAAASAAEAVGRKQELKADEEDEAEVEEEDEDKMLSDEHESENDGPTRRPGKSGAK